MAVFYYWFLFREMQFAISNYLQSIRVSCWPLYRSHPHQELILIQRSHRILSNKSATSTPALLIAQDSSRRFHTAASADKYVRAELVGTRFSHRSTPFVPVCFLKKPKDVKRLQRFNSCLLIYPPQVPKSLLAPLSPSRSSLSVLKYVDVLNRTGMSKCCISAYMWIK